MAGTTRSDRVIAEGVATPQGSSDRRGRKIAQYTFTIVRLRLEESMKVGFIGTGTMGQPMLANLVKKGFQAVAYDTAAAALEAAVRLGAERAGSAAEAAAGGELVITMLPSSANVEAAYLGAGGILEAVM